MSIAEALITAEEFAEMPDDGRYLELVEGRIIELPPPQRPHGHICFQDRLDSRPATSKAHDLGTILINDTGIITRRNPDSVRGADVAYYSFARLPRGPVPDAYGRRRPRDHLRGPIAEQPLARRRNQGGRISQPGHAWSSASSIPKPRSAGTL